MTQNLTNQISFSTDSGVGDYHYRCNAHLPRELFKLAAPSRPFVDNDEWRFSIRGIAALVVHGHAISLDDKPIESIDDLADAIAHQWKSGGRERVLDYLTMPMDEYIEKYP